MRLDILSPEGSLFGGNVDSVTLPGVVGSFTVLKNHAPLISALQAGKIKYKVSGSGEECEVDVKGGFTEVKKNMISVCIE
ncbi:F0F1 ATP synthase subunit epsilon [Parabacteroides sp. Marseille-P3160]|mgnify:CR=1 FL=1|uniref:F0F1 ATP synthase subunit epsilon n=1 Tax=Parabacteroides sp. Marseille-P3160 TaxID=1917887 RepID=UPI0009BAAC5F|nr:hypothetical protein [Parabacteroides sp. Marseille-P3160]